MNRPAMISGSAVIASTMVRTGRASGPPTSTRNSAANTPSGTAITVAIAICSSDPTSACTMPPDVSGSSGPASAIVWVKKLGCRIASQPRSST